MFNFTTLPPLSLYIHVPWCVRKCPYCDFNSHKSPDNLPEASYIDALIRDLEQEMPSVWGRTVQNIFIGGGTPSLFSAEAYERLFSSIRALIPLSPHAEITLEANPGTFEAQRFSDYRDLGINRLSIGVQSFNDQSLTALGRIHDSKQAIKAIETAHKVGFDNFNLDLMFGLPHQTEKTARHDVATAIALAPSHISYYQLTLEPNTLFYQNPPTLPDEDPIIDWQIANQQQLAEAGYQQYEVSAYAKGKNRCQHNLNYWQFGDYLGIGAGAHGKITDAAKQTITRRSKQKQPQAFIDTAGSPSVILTEEVISKRDIGFEFMLNALRLTDGFPTPLFYQHAGLPISHIDKALQYAEQEGLLTRDIHFIRPTEKGQRYLNVLIELFLPE
ncbi:MAG: radical SAM family heme chaperone HemW [Pseudomonadota bacterium]|nr:radical SAM family heme chaperone HemW [Pseudomonadota bacterium]MDO7711265.1 radical SAM family heme chaperone HemW [Pseudomonadota bacterium]